MKQLPLMKVYYGNFVIPKWQLWPADTPQPTLKDLYTFRLSGHPSVAWYNIVISCVMVSEGESIQTPYIFHWDIKYGITKGMLV